MSGNNKVREGVAKTMLISTIKSGLITSLINVANADQANTDRFMFRMAFA
jgi:hypothetical protein